MPSDPNYAAFHKAFTKASELTGELFAIDQAMREPVVKPKPGVLEERIRVLAARNEILVTAIGEAMTWPGSEGKTEFLERALKQAAAL